MSQEVNGSNNTQTGGDVKPGARDNSKTYMDNGISFQVAVQNESKGVKSPDNTLGTPHDYSLLPSQRTRGRREDDNLSPQSVAKEHRQIRAVVSTECQDIRERLRKSEQDTAALINNLETTIVDAITTSTRNKIGATVLTGLLCIASLFVLNNNIQHNLEKTGNDVVTRNTAGRETRHNQDKEQLRELKAAFGDLETEVRYHHPNGG